MNVQAGKKPWARVGGSSLTADNAYDEFCRREAAGQHVDLDEFLAEYADIRTALAPTLQLHRFMDESPQAQEPRPLDYWPSAGDYFEGFQLLRELGRGSFARVFLAEENALGRRKVAVKISFRGTVEASTLGRLDHPNIVPVFSVQENAASKLAVICMPYLGKATVEDLLEPIFASGKVPTTAELLLEVAADPDAPEPTAADLGRHDSHGQAVRHLARQLFDALAFIHARGIIHRDLKPSNFLLRPSGAPMVLDFNLAADSMLPELLNGGTPDFMAPEQIQAHAKLIHPPPAITAAVDVFSLGLVCYVLLTGRHPFWPAFAPSSSRQLAKDLVANQQQGPQPIRQLNPAVEPKFAQLIEACLAFAPKDRPTAHQVADRLRPQHGWKSVARQAVARHPWRTVLAAGFLGAALLAAGTLVALPSARPSPREQARAAFQEGRYAHAIRLASQALAEEPDDLETLFLRGRAYQRQGEADPTQFGSAYADFKECFQRKGEGRFQALMGYCAHRQGQFKPAKVHYDQGLALGFSPAIIHNNLGRLAWSQTNDPGQLRAAEDHLEKALALDKDLTAAHFNLASLHVTNALTMAKVNGPSGSAKLALLNRALDHCQQALAVGPVTTDLLFLTGRAHALALEQEDRHLDLAIMFLRKAHHEGLPGERLHSLERLRQLSADSRFVTLVKTPSTQKHPTSTVCIIDPCDD